MNKQIIKVYTDGSCHTQQRIGTWVAIVLFQEEKIVLSGFEYDTSHNRMELLGILKAIEFLRSEGFHHTTIEIYSDSQYAVNLRSRKEKLELNGFQTKKGSEIRNSDLVKSLLLELELLDIVFHKVKAHQQDGDPINREADLLVRNALRKLVKK